jgi:hypothetical protein
MLLTSLLPVIVLARLGAASAAYVAIPMHVLAILTVVPSMTAQSFFAEMAAHPEESVEPVRKALRGVYIATLPLDVVTVRPQSAQPFRTRVLNPRSGIAQVGSCLERILLPELRQRHRSFGL